MKLFNLLFLLILLAGINQLKSITVVNNGFTTNLKITHMREKLGATVELVPGEKRTINVEPTDTLYIIATDIPAEQGVPD